MSQYFHYCGGYWYGCYTIGASGCASPVAIRSVNVFGVKILDAWYFSYVVSSSGFVWQLSVLKTLFMIGQADNSCDDYNTDWCSTLCPYSYRYNAVFGTTEKGGRPLRMWFRTVWP